MYNIIKRIKIYVERLEKFNHKEGLVIHFHPILARERKAYFPTKKKKFPLNHSSSVTPHLECESDLEYFVFLYFYPKLYFIKITNNFVKYVSRHSSFGYGCGRTITHYRHLNRFYSRKCGNRFFLSFFLSTERFWYCDSTKLLTCLV